MISLSTYTKLEREPCDCRTARSRRLTSIQSQINGEADQFYRRTLCTPRALSSVSVYMSTLTCTRPAERVGHELTIVTEPSLGDEIYGKTIQ